MIGRLWSGLKDRSLDDKINIILVGDHGTVRSLLFNYAYAYFLIFCNAIIVSVFVNIALYVSVEHEICLYQAEFRLTPNQPQTLLNAPAKKNTTIVIFDHFNWIEFADEIFK